MKKTTLISIFLFILFTNLIIVPQAFAQLPTTQDELINPFGNDPAMKSPVNDIHQTQRLVIEMIKWFYTIVFVAALITILFAAFNFIRGGSDEKKLAIAKAQLKWAVVGMVVGMIAGGVSLVMKEFLSNTYIPPIQERGPELQPDPGINIPTNLSGTNVPDKPAP